MFVVPLASSVHSSIQPGGSLRVACDLLPAHPPLHGKWKEKQNGS